MNMKTKFVAVTLLAMAALCAFAALGRYEARLMGTQGKAKAKWVAKQVRSEFQGELEIEGEKLARNSHYTVHLLGKNISVTTNNFGAFNYAMRFTNATTAPNIGAGTPVTVTNAGGATVLSGTFAAR